MSFFPSSSLFLLEPSQPGIYSSLPLSEHGPLDQILFSPPLLVSRSDSRAFLLSGHHVLSIHLNQASKKTIEFLFYPLKRSHSDIRIFITSLDKDDMEDDSARKEWMSPKELWKQDTILLKQDDLKSNSETRVEISTKGNDQEWFLFIATN